MTDLVEQIRERVAVFQPGGDNERLLVLAANEIESLRREVATMERWCHWVWEAAPYVTERDTNQDVPWRG